MNGTRIAVLEARIAELERELEEAQHDPVYGVMTRAGLDRRARVRDTEQYDTVVFMDIDDMHLANKNFGYSEVDRRITRAVNVGSAQVLIGRFYAGDELVLLCHRRDALGLARRLRAQFQAVGLSATFGIAPCAANWPAGVGLASSYVQRAKLEDRRGSITFGSDHE